MPTPSSSLALPPSTGRLWTRAGRGPSRAAAMAAQQPAAPAPTTTTSNVAFRHRVPRHAAQPAPLLLQRLEIAGRRVAEIARQQQRIAAAEVARQIVQRQLHRAGRQVELARRLPRPTLRCPPRRGHVPRGRRSTETANLPGACSRIQFLARTHRR